MNPRLEGKTDPRLARCQADLAACMQALFRRCPLLCGFAVHEGAIALADMTCYPMPDDESLGEMRQYITGALLEFVDEQPEAVLLVSGRTFARALH